MGGHRINANQIERQTGFEPKKNSFINRYRKI